MFCKSVNVQNRSIDRCRVLETTRIIDLPLIDNYYWHIAQYLTQSLTLVADYEFLIHDYNSVNTVTDIKNVLAMFLQISKRSE